MMRRVKRSLYYSVNMICAKLGFADKRVLVRLFRAFCTSLYGCELWKLTGERKAVQELCVAYHSSLKKLVNVPRWSRNHNLCHDFELLTCPMLLAYRQLLFWCRLQSSQNCIVSALVNSTVVGKEGVTAKNHLQIRAEYDLLDLDFDAVNGTDIGNILSARLERFVCHRREVQMSVLGPEQCVT